MIYAFWSLVSAFVFLKGRLETETQSVLCAAVFCFEWRKRRKISGKCSKTTKAIISLHARIGNVGI